MAYKAYDIDSGSLVMSKLAAFQQMFGQAPFYEPTGHMRPTGALLRSYAEAQVFNIEVATRFQPDALSARRVPRAA